MKRLRALRETSSFTECESLSVARAEAEVEMPSKGVIWPTEEF